MHLDGLSSNPAAEKARAKIGKSFLKAPSFLRAAPRLSAQALEMPRECVTSALPKMYKNLV